MGEWGNGGGTSSRRARRRRPRYQSFGDLSYPKTYWDGAAAWARETFPGKPMVISETGAGGLFEWDANATDDMWTQNYQVEVIAADVDAALANPNVSGLTLWHFFDFKGNDDATRECGQCDYLEVRCASEAHCVMCGV